VLFYQDNIPADTFAVSMTKLHERFALVGHPSYSPDLTLCDFFLFPDLKK